jgi:hypothetical protein
LASNSNLKSRRCGIISEVFTRDKFTVCAEKLFTDEVSKEKESHFMQQQILCHFVKDKVTKDAHVKQNVFRKIVNATLHVLSATLNDFHFTLH